MSVERRLVEPVQPATESRHPAALEQRLGELLEQCRGAFEIAGLERVAECLLGQRMVLAPVGRLGQQGVPGSGLAPLQLVTEHRPEELVIAVPAPLVIQRDEEQVRPLDRAEHRRRSSPADDGVAQRSGHPIEDRRPVEEAQLTRRQPGGKLGAEEVLDVAVAVAEGGGRRDAAGPGVQLERREVEPGRPALRPMDELGDVGQRQLQPGAGEQRRGLLDVQRQVLGPELEEPASGPQSGDRKARFAARDERQLRPVGQVPAEQGDEPEHVGVADLVHVVEDEQDRPRQAGHREGERRQDPGPDRDRSPAEGAEEVGVERLDPVDRRREVGEQHDRVVVMAVERQPGDVTRVDRRPLRQQRGLAIAGRGAHEHDPRPLRGAQPLDHHRAADHPRTRRRELELCLEHRQPRSVRDARSDRPTANDRRIDLHRHPRSIAGPCKRRTPDAGAALDAGDRPDRTASDARTGSSAHRRRRAARGDCPGRRRSRRPGARRGWPPPGR